MAKHDESKGEVLSTEEMKTTKGGLGAASEALARGTAVEAPKRTIIEEASLQDEASLPVSRPAAGATEDAMRIKGRR